MIGGPGLDSDRVFEAEDRDSKSGLDPNVIGH